MNGHSRQSPVATATPPQATQSQQQQQHHHHHHQEGLSGGGFEEGANRGDIPMAQQQAHSHQHAQQQRFQPHREGESLMPRTIINVPASTTIMRSDTIPSTQQEMYGPTAGAGGGMAQPTAAFQQTANIYPQGQAAAPIYQSIQHPYYFNPSTGQYYGTPVQGAYMTAGVPQALLMTPQQQQQAYHQHQQQVFAAQHMAVAQQQQQPHPQGAMAVPAHHGPAGVPMPSVTSVAQMPPVSVMSGAGAASAAAAVAAQQSAAVSVAHGIMAPGTTHLQTANVVVTSTGPGQPIPPQQQPQREKKLLKFTDPVTKEELDLSTGVTNESKRKAKPTADGRDREAEETDKSIHAKEFQKRIAERMKYGADSDDLKAEAEGNGTMPTVTPPPAVPQEAREGSAASDQTKQSDAPKAEGRAQKMSPPSQRQPSQEAPTDQQQPAKNGEQIQPQLQQHQPHVSGTVANFVVQQPIHHQTRLTTSPTVTMEQPQQQQQQPQTVHPSPPPQQIHIGQQQRLSPIPRIQPRPLLDLIVENPQKIVIEQQQTDPTEHQQTQPQQQHHQTVPKIVGTAVSHCPPDEMPPTVVSPTAPAEEEEEEQGTTRANTTEPMGWASRKGSQNELNGEDDPSGADRLTPSLDEGSEALTEERIRELEEQMQQMEFSDENNNPEQLIYSRKFLYFIRKVTMALKTVNCPKSEEELEELGLSRRGMPIVQTFSASGKAKRFDSTSSDQFKTPWQQAGGGTMNQFGTGGGGRFTTTRPPYAGRHSDNKLKPKKGPIARQSLDQRPIKLAQVSSSPQVADTLPRRSANAWKPKREERFDMNAPARNEEEVKYEKLCKEVRGLLNKVTPSTYKELSEEFIQYKIHEDAKLLEVIIDLIFDKAVEEPHFCPLYSDLCKKQVEEEKTAMADKPPTEKSFRTEIIQKCQKTFTVSNHFDEKIAELKKKIDDLEKGDEKGRAQVEEEIEGRRSKEKRRLLGIIRFISQLYRHQLLIDKIINWCAVELIKRYEVTKDEVYIEYAVELLETVGKVYEERQQKPPRTFSQASDQKDSFSLDKIFSHLSSLKKEMSNRIRFAIMEVEDLRSNKWMPRGGEKGPKTIEEVREEVEKEQQENELERIEHEKQKEKEKMQQQSARKGSRPSYGGRSSADRRSAAAANVSSLLTSSRAESRIAGLSKLREVDNFGLGGGRKRWDHQRDRTPQKEEGTAAPTAATGDSAGGGASASETAWRPMSRMGTDSPKDNAGGQTGGD